VPDRDRNIAKADKRFSHTSERTTPIAGPKQNPIEAIAYFLNIRPDRRLAAGRPINSGNPERLPRMIMCGGVHCVSERFSVKSTLAKHAYRQSNALARLGFCPANMDAKKSLALNGGPSNNQLHKIRNEDATDAC
jgi:hypothetical protein